MKAFHCTCGQRVFFDNDECLACGRALGFDVQSLDVLTLDRAGQSRLKAADGRAFRPCANQVDHGNCNWLVPREDPNSLCPSCRMNEVIPALDRPGNVMLWTRVEQAKRRLLYSLASLELPLERQDGQGWLRFRLLEDQRRNPDVFESFVSTAHTGGAITINIAEADDAVRHAVREEMQERYRTVLGHLRHECGHFYFGVLVQPGPRLEECRRLFGDETADYQAAVESHYASGPPADWQNTYVSAYASAHPSEDFAETFAHYLHIHDALETAAAAGLAWSDSASPLGSDWVGDWLRLSVALNEMLRSLGADDAYPFVITPRVREKLEFIDRLLHPPA